MFCAIYLGYFDLVSSFVNRKDVVQFKTTATPFIYNSGAFGCRKVDFRILFVNAILLQVLKL